MVAKKYKFKTKKFFKRKTIKKNSFLYPYLHILKIKENILINRTKIFILNKLISQLIQFYGKLKLNNFSFNVYTNKPVSARMGKGKGIIAGYNLCLKKGSTIISIESSQKNLFNKIVYKKLSNLIPCFIYSMICKI